MAWQRGEALRGLMVLAFALALMPSRALPQEIAPPRQESSVDLPLTPADEPASAIVPTRPSTDPTAAAVYAVLEKHCVRCHQSGRLDRVAPAGAFGNVLHLEGLATTPSLVLPGNPDASRLYLTMLRRLMPLDASADAVRHPWPTSDEIAHVRSWITGLSPRRHCRDRRTVGAAEHAATLSQLGQVTGEDPKKLRFLSIAHLHNNCTRPEALAAYRQAIVRIVNSLSWKTAPVAAPPIDPARTLFKISLDDLGWRPEHWERIMSSGTGPLGLTAPLPSEIGQTYGTAIPIARADWFAKTVLSAPLYYEVLGLPGTGSEILKILQTAPASSAGNPALRVPITRPSTSLQTSVIERYQSRYGPIWQAYHWLAGQETPIIDPAKAAAPVHPSSPHHAARGMFTLPNGLPSFFIIDGSGSRLDALPPDIAAPSVAGRSPITAGLDCMACHRQGPSAPSATGDALPRSIAQALDADRQAISSAMHRVGIDPELTIDGVAPVVALAEEFARPLDGRRAAAELGIDLAALLDLADRGDDAMSVLARRLVQGLVPRSEIEGRARELAMALGRPRLDTVKGGDRPTPDEGHRAPAEGGPRLILYSDKARYRKGDALQVTVKVAAACHLTIVSIDTRGRGTVLFPSDFEANGLLSAGQELRLPGPGAPYSLRLNESGRETIVALCNEVSAFTDNIRHDFERQRFTELGNYAAYLSQHALIDQGQTDTAPAGSSRRGRGQSSGDAAPERPARPDQITRTAISIIVE